MFQRVHRALIGDLLIGIEIDSNRGECVSGMYFNAIVDNSQVTRISSEGMGLGVGIVQSAKRAGCINPSDTKEDCKAESKQKAQIVRVGNGYEPVKLSISNPGSAISPSWISCKL
jgi:hypothetical protein